MCVDVFRGFAVAGMILIDNPGDDEKAFWPIQHAQWNGWTPADLIFPSFLFLVGVSTVFSFSARLERGESRAAILRHALLRTLILIGIGVFLNGFPLFRLDGYRILGVLQRIAVCYFVAAILVLWGSWRSQLATALACLFGYWALMRFVHVPGFGVPGRDIPFMDMERNIVAWLDRSMFPGRLWNGNRDPEGILSTIPAMATTLFGVLTGHWLRAPRRPVAIAMGLVACGILGLLAGELWNACFPINKNLWTSSFAVFAAGFALSFLALLYWVIEIRDWRAWTPPLLVFGMNPIGGYVADALVYGPAYSFHVQGPDGSRITWQQCANQLLLSAIPHPPLASLAYSLIALLFCWILVWMLWRKRIFLKV
jgi:predicted acyltransferase